MNYIFGPLVSSSDLSFHQRMFEQVFNLETVAQGAMNSAAVSRVWGTTGQTAKIALLKTPQSRYGVQVIEFSPGTKSTIRQRTRGLVPGAAKVIDFFVSDMQQALRRAREFGLVINADIAKYESPEGSVQEAHSWVLDEVVCALIEPPKQMEDKFSSGLKRDVSEPQSISGPTTELKASAEYFQRVFEFNVIYEYEVSDSNFGAMIGSSEPVHIKAKNVGWDLRAPYIGMIDYGLAKPGDETIDPVVPPVRGLLGVTIITQDIAAISARANPESVVVAASSGGLVGPWVDAPCMLLRAPNGMLLQVIEQ